MKKMIFLLLISALIGCGSNMTLLAWKPTTVVVKDNTAGKPEGQQGSIVVMTSPNQPFEASGNTATVTGKPQ